MLKHLVGRSSEKEPTEELIGPFPARRILRGRGLERGSFFRGRDFLSRESRRFASFQIMRQTD